MVTLTFRTHFREEMLDITDTLRKLVLKNQLQNGALTLFCPHTTCALTINEGADPDVKTDMVSFFKTLIPKHGSFLHAEGNSDAHIKTSLFGPSLMLIVENNHLALGRWQSVYLCESDGPRTRNLWVQWLPSEPITV